MKWGGGVWLVWPVTAAPTEHYFPLLLEHVTKGWGWTRLQKMLSNDGQLALASSLECIGIA